MELVFVYLSQPMPPIRQLRTYHYYRRLFRTVHSLLFRILILEEPITTRKTFLSDVRFNSRLVENARYRII